ncbi:MAG: cytochrome b/b6 domain-containing protein [Burkholderiales bacterium]
MSRDHQDAASESPQNRQLPKNAERLLLIWDLPTRIFHWTLAVSFFIALATGDSDRFRDIHVFSGYLILGLICFRVLWGFAGSRYARFKSFLFGPRAAITYLGDLVAARTARHLGHNPAGSWAIFAMLTLGLLICVSGVVVLGAEESHGILQGFAGHPLGEMTKELHESLSWLMLGLVLMHVAGVLIESRAHRENLIKGMLTGRKLGAANDGIDSSHRLVAVAMLVCVLAGAAWFLRGRLIEVPGMAHLPFVGKHLPDNKAWRDECSSCHVAYHPTLLPARSWKALMDRQDDHFGEKLGLDEATVTGILDFLQRNSAETGMTEPAYKINRSIPADQTPLRITETGYWIEKHRDVGDSVWKHSKVRSKANCGACHLDAEQGTYEDAAMRLPR